MRRLRKTCYGNALVSTNVHRKQSSVGRVRLAARLRRGGDRKRPGATVRSGKTLGAADKIGRGIRDR